MSEPGREITDLEMMANPETWERALLPLVNKGETGVLVQGPLGRFIWYKGANIEGTQQENEQFLKNPKIMLAPGLQDLINDGWEIG